MDSRAFPQPKRVPTRHTLTPPGPRPAVRLPTAPCEIRASSERWLPPSPVPSATHARTDSSQVTPRQLGPTHSTPRQAQAKTTRTAPALPQRSMVPQRMLRTALRRLDPLALSVSGMELAGIRRLANRSLATELKSRKPQRSSSPAAVKETVAGSDGEP